MAPSGSYSRIHTADVTTPPTTPPKTCFLQIQAAICGVSHVAACREESVCCCCEKAACSRRRSPACVCVSVCVCVCVCQCVCQCVRRAWLLGRSSDRQQTERQAAPAEPALLCSEHATRTCSSADYTLVIRSYSSHTHTQTHTHTQAQGLCSAAFPLSV